MYNEYMNPIDTNRTPEQIKNLCNDYVTAVVKSLKLKIKGTHKKLSEKEQTTILEADMNYPASPKFFRDIYLDIPKSTISRWKTGTVEQQEMWNLIHTTVHKISSALEVTLLHTADSSKARSILAILSAWDMDRYNTKVITAKISRETEMERLQRQAEERVALLEAGNPAKAQLSIAIPHTNRLEIANEPEATN